MKKMRSHRTKVNAMKTMKVKSKTVQALMKTEWVNCLSSTTAMMTS